jgi:hypothetical protein
MSNTAQLSLNVTQFVENTSTTPGAPFCAADNPTIMNGPGSSGPQNASGQVGIDPDDSSMIFVNRKNAANSAVTLVFNLTGVAGLQATDIKFRQDLGSGDPDGSNNFNNKSASGATISVDNQWQSHGKKKGPGGNQAPTWKYFIRVQDASGKLGWIDPGIENAEDL